MLYYKEGNKSDKVDARKVADLLRTGMLRPVYHGEHGLRTLRELGRSYQTISHDLNRVMNRLKARFAPTVSNVARKNCGVAAQN
jgi:hypothetical protein